MAKLTQAVLTVPTAAGPAAVVALEQCLPCSRSNRASQS